LNKATSTLRRRTLEIATKRIAKMKATAVYTLFVSKRSNINKLIGNMRQ
jgi:hypothetical protein